MAGSDELRGLIAAAMVLGSTACGAPQHARYPGWEPTSPVVPEQPDRELARRHLEQSRRIWRQQRGAKYTYVRTRQLSQQKLQFTVLVVDGSRVVRRSLLTAEIEPYTMRRHGLGLIRTAPAVVWDESGQTVGRHTDGAPARSIDQLYQLCRTEVLGAHPELTPRLFFDPSGVLEHCGFSVDECEACPSASIDSYAKFFPEPEQQPTDYVCATHFGLVVATASPHWPLARQCTCTAYPRPKNNRRLAAASDCQLDPDACPRSNGPAQGNWSCGEVDMEPDHRCGFQGAPEPADFGKPTPTESWTPGQHRVCW